MDSKELLGLVEAYNAVHNEDLREDFYEEYDFHEENKPKKTFEGFKF